MSIVRTAAQKVSAMVVCYSSAGNKEWAEGLAREVDFIRSDWGALLWSMGSLRVLLDRRPAPIRTYDDLWPLVKKFEESASVMRNMTICSALYITIYSGKFFEKCAFPKHIGFIMLVAGWVAIGIRSFPDWRTKKKILEEKDLPNLVRHYRIDLERLANTTRSLKWWLGCFATALLIPGVILTAPDLISPELICLYVLVFLVAIVSGVYTRRNARRQLQELDTLLKTKP